MTTTAPKPTTKTSGNTRIGVTMLPQRLHLMQPLLEDQDIDFIISGYGSCMACDCRGYIRDGDKPICKTCQHAFSRHRD